MEKLNVKALALALGISWAVCMLFTGWVLMFGWGVKFVEVMSSIYIGFTPIFLSGIIGTIWGFIDGVISGVGVIIAFIYNAIVIKKR